jgi:hypothetical protein
MSVFTSFRRAAVPLAVFVVFFGVLAGCAKIRPITAPSPERGRADYGIYVAVGTNFTAGFQSGGLAQRHQVNSYANLFAMQAGVPRFTYPAVNLGGWPPLLRVRSFQPLVLDSAGVRGAFINPLESPPARLDSAYSNMAIPGALLADVNDPFLNYNPGLGRDVSFFFHIARQQGRTFPLSILQLVRNEHPTFVSFEYGLNELMGPAIRGSGTPVLPGGAWAGLLHVTLDSLDINCPNAKKLIVNVFDVTKTPFFHTLPPVELDGAGRPTAKFLLGVSPGDLVTLTANDSLEAGVGYAVGDTSYLSGIPVPGTGRPLPGTFVLDPTEVASIRATTDQYNAAVAAEAAARGYALLDVHEMLDDFAASGVRIGGVTYTTAYLTGGLFSVDGLHPTDLFHGLVCNEMIRVVNSKFGSRIPPLDLTRVMTSTSSSLAPARGVVAASP